MVQALVRGVLWQHLHHAVAAPSGFSMHGGPAQTAPNALVDAEPFSRALDAIRRERGDAYLRDLGRDYVALWGRTFRTLTRHLRGRPERALQLFADEVYPFLRGDRRAARVESAGRGQARLVLHDDLPAPYLAGMVEAFVGLSQADAVCEPRGQEMFEVAYRVASADRLSRLTVLLASLRIPFLMAAAMAAVLGIAVAAAEGIGDIWQAGAVLSGSVGVQGAANALHDLRARRSDGPFSAPRPHPAWLWTVTVGGYGVAAAAGGFLVLHGAPWIIAFAVVGLMLSLLYARFSAEGLGPIMAGLTFGPLMTMGALYGMIGTLSGSTAWFTLAVSIPLGALAAAIVFLNDLADRPLDEAAGRRTLLVRLPRTGQVVGYGALVVGGATGLMLAAAWRFGTKALPLLFAVLAGGLLVWWVRRHADDPHTLAPARFGTLALHVLAAASLTLLVLEGTA